jgi:nucleotide-binding universal stress UspA family protein
MFGTVLVPLDGSLEAEGAIPYAVDEATRRDCRLVLLRVVPRPELADVRGRHGGPSYAGRPAPHFEAGAAIEAALDYLRDVIRRHGLAAETETVVPTGNPQTRLEVEIARRARPLVVLAGDDETARRLMSSGTATILCVRSHYQAAPAQALHGGSTALSEPGGATAF